MRSPQKSNRARGRGNRKGGGSNVNRVFESAGPEGKVRGTAQQIIDKYLSLARDAQTSGDRVASENFLQHAEHYQRVLALAMGQQQERREQAQSDEDGEQGEDEARERQDEGRQDRREQPAQAGGGDGQDRQRGADSGVSGMQTIDSGDDDGPDLLVTPEEMGSGRSRRRGNGRRRPSGGDGPSHATESAESASD